MKPPAPFEVVEVQGRADHKAFCALPYELYRGDARWIPPLRLAEAQRWSARHNASLKTRRVRRFLARRGGRAVGRVAAIVDEAFAERWEAGAGFFGFFECVDDQAVCDNLLSAAHEALRAAGMRRALGPVNLSTHEEVGLLVAGFETPPTVLTPYNPPYYGVLLSAAGYEPRLDYHSYLWTPAHRQAPVVERLVRSAARNAGWWRRLVVRPFDARRWEAENRTLWRLYNVCFQDVWGFVPLSWEEYMERAEVFRRFYRPELVLIAEFDGEAVGFGLSLPDVNSALNDLDGRLLPFGWLRLARRVPRIRASRFILSGVAPEFRGRGLSALIAARMGEAMLALGMERVEVSLVHEANQSMQRVIRAFGCDRLKSFRLYEKSLLN
jgi:hypothetical protein